MTDTRIVRAERYDGVFVDLLPGVKLVECPICEWCHPQTFNGDCRQDSARFITTENYDGLTDFFDVNDSRRDDPDYERQYFDDEAPGELGR